MPFGLLGPTGTLVPHGAFAPAVDAFKAAVEVDDIDFPGLEQAARSDAAKTMATETWVRLDLDFSMSLSIPPLPSLVFFAAISILAQTRSRRLRCLPCRATAARI